MSALFSFLNSIQKKKKQPTSSQTSKAFCEQTLNPSSCNVLALKARIIIQLTGFWTTVCNMHISFVSVIRQECNGCNMHMKNSL